MAGGRVVTRRWRMADGGWSAINIDPASTDADLEMQIQVPFLTAQATVVSILSLLSPLSLRQWAIVGTSATTTSSDTALFLPPLSPLQLPTYKLPNGQEGRYPGTSGRYPGTEHRRYVTY